MPRTETYSILEKIETEPLLPIKIERRPTSSVVTVITSDIVSRFFLSKFAICFLLQAIPVSRLDA